MCPKLAFSMSNLDYKSRWLLRSPKSLINVLMGKQICEQSFAEYKPARLPPVGCKSGGLLLNGKLGEQYNQPLAYNKQIKQTIWKHSGPRKH